MPICASRQAVHSIYQLIHIYDGFRLMNLVFIINHIHSVYNYHISIPYSLSYSHLWRIPFDESRPYYRSPSFGFQISHFNSIITFVLSFQKYTQSMYLFHILIQVLISYAHAYTHSHTHSCAHFIYSFTYSFTYTHSCILIHKYSFTYSFHILIHIFIYVYSFMYTHS